MGSRDLVIGYGSALDYWRAMRCAETGAGWDETPNGRVYGAQRLTLSERAARAAAECRTDLPLEVVIREKGVHHNSPAVKDRVFKGPLGSSRLYGLGDEVHVCAIEPVFAQLGTELDSISLALLANELCGTYGFHADGVFEGDLQPLTTVGDLKTYAAAAKTLGVRGAARALAALGWAVDGSASPRESEVAVFLKANRRCGGAGLMDFVMNGKVSVPKECAQLTSAKCFKPDFMWKDERVILEYDSNEYHLSPQEKTRDEARRRILERMGFRVISLTAQALRDENQINAFAYDLEQALGKRRLPLSDGLAATRRSLCERLFCTLGSFVTRE